MRNDLVITKSTKIKDVLLKYNIPLYIPYDVVVDKLILNYISTDKTRCLIYYRTEITCATCNTNCILHYKNHEKLTELKHLLKKETVCLK